MVQKMLLSEKIAETIMTGIKSGFYKVGYQMPNEMELSSELGVSRATLREAFKILISKNILEVRRGIGTFVSETPGFSVDGIGIGFLDLPMQKNEIVKLLKMLYEEEILAFQHLPFNLQSDMLERLTTCRKSTEDVVEAILEMAETIALSRQATFKHRLMVIVHTAFVNVMDLKKIRFDAHLENSFDSLCASFESGNPFTYFEDFIMRLTQRDKED